MKRDDVDTTNSSRGKDTRGDTPATAKDPAKSTLLTYFKEMSSNSLLTPESEAGLAKEIEAREEAAWAAALSYPPTVAFAIGFAAERLETAVSEFPALKGSATRAKRARTIKSQEALERAAHKAARALRPLDLDQSLLEALVVELGRLRDSKSAVGGFSPTCKGYARYLAGVAAARRAARESRNRFVTSNLGLVVSVARRYQHSGMPLVDLIQEGNLGLIKAVERFDHSRGFRFSTYATWWIRHSIGRAIADKGRTVRVPVHVLEANQKINKTLQELSAKLGRQPTREELSGATEIPVEKLEKTQRHAHAHAMSLDAPMGDDGDRERLEIFSDDNAEGESPFDAIETQSMIERVQAAMHRLQPIEVDVLRRRFGLGGEEEVTLQEIASSYGLSRERIRQIQEKALGKVRGTLVQERAI